MFLQQFVLIVLFLFDLEGYNCQIRQAGVDAERVLY